MSISSAEIRNLNNISRHDLKARWHALRPCEPERKVVYTFSKKTSYELFLEGEQRANLIKLCTQSLLGKVFEQLVRQK